MKRSLKSNIAIVNEIIKKIESKKQIELENNLNNVSHIQVLKFLNMMKEQKSVNSNVRERISSQLYRLLDNTYKQLKDLSDSDDKPDQMLPWGQTMQHWAIDNEKDYPEKIIKSVIERFNPNQFDQQGRHPLYFAASIKSIKSLKLLLKNGANLTLKTKFSGENLLYFLLQNGRQDDQIYKDMYKIVLEQYQQAGININTPEIISDLVSFKRDQYEGYTPLIASIWQKATQTFDLLLQLTQSTTDKDQIGQTPLYFLCQSGRLDNSDFRRFYDKLNDSGIPLTNRNYEELNEYIKGHYNDNTPLIEAIRSKKLKTFEVVLDLTKNVTAPNLYKEDPLYYMCMEGRLDEEEIFNFYNKIKDKIQQKQIDGLVKFKINRSENMTPLINSIYRKKYRTFETIIELTKTLRGRTKNRQSALFYMCQDGRLDEPEIMKMLDYLKNKHPNLINKHKRQIQKFNIKVHQGQIPLIQAILKNKKKTFEEILKITRSIKEKNQYGETVVYWLLQNGRQDDKKYQDYLKIILEDDELLKQINFDELLTYVGTYDQYYYNLQPPIINAISEKKIKTFNKILEIEKLLIDKRIMNISPNFPRTINESMGYDQVKPLPFLLINADRYNVKRETLIADKEKNQEFSQILKIILENSYHKHKDGYHIRHIQYNTKDDYEDEVKKIKKEKYEKEQKKLKEEEKEEEVSDDSDDQEDDKNIIQDDEFFKKQYDRIQKELDDTENIRENYIKQGLIEKKIYKSTLNGLILKSFSRFTQPYMKFLFLSKHDPQIEKDIIKEIKAKNKDKEDFDASDIEEKQMT